MKKIYNRDSASVGWFQKRKKSWRYSLSLLFGMFTFLSFGFSNPILTNKVNAVKAINPVAVLTTCANATVISPGSLPITNQALVCGATNDVTSANSTSCGSGSYKGGLESLYSFTPTTTGSYTISMSGQSWTGIFVTSGCPTSGGVCVGNVTSSSSSKSLSVTLTSGIEYFIMFDTYPSPNSPCPGTFSMNLVEPCVTPSASPTDLVFGTTTATGISASFTAASPEPSKYLVVRSTSATAPTPVNGTVYTVGATTLGAGTNVRLASNALTFSDTGLTAETNYYYYVFSYNDACTGAPFYNTTPLSGSQYTRCATGTTLAFNSITTNSANLTWTGSGEYIVEYGLTGFTPGTGSDAGIGGTIASSNATSPFALTGLEGSTSYSVFVRQICALGGYSPNSSAGSLNTLCDLVTTFSQNWDSVAANTLPVCFNKVGTLGTVYAQAGSSSSGANTLYIYGGSTSSEPTLALQPVSNAGAGTHWLKFKLRANFTVGGKLQVGYLTNPTDATSFVMIQEFIANSATTYEEFKCIPGTLPGSNTTLALKAKGSPANSMLVDDLVWELIPSCLSPSVFSSTNLTTSTATLNWTASTSNPTNGYDIYYSTTNTAPLAGTTPTVNNHTASPLNATGLTSASTYYWWVRSDCGAETSAWAFGGSFTTLCDLVTTFSQNWDGVAANALPVCFNKVGTLGSVYAQAGSTSSGANTLYIYASNSSSEPTLALQPVSNAGAGTHWLKFKLRANFTVGGKLQVGYLTNPTDETSFVMIQEFIANSITTYEEFKCIPGTLPGSNTTLALRAKGSPANSMLVDDLVWELTPSCLSPSLFSSSNLTASTATLNWTASNSNPTNGYDIYYNTVNTAPLVDTMPTINNQTGVSANLADLTSATTYFWWIRSDCGAETSSWATGGSFTTLCNAVSIPTNLETFESSNSGVPVCWSTGLVSGTENWDVATGDAGDIEAAYAGSNFMEKNYTSSDAILISFPIDYSSITNSTRINTYLHRHASAHANDQYKIYINTSPSLTGATEIFSLYSKTSIAPTVAATGWYNYTINIPTSFNGQSSIYVIFEGITTAGFDSYDLGIDDFKVEITPCPEWTGAISTAWNVAGNWCDNTVPSALTNVIINSANPAIISTDVTVASITLGATAVVTVNGTLNVGNITVASGGQMTVANDAAILQTNGATNSGQVTVKRNSTDLFRQDYTLWSSPVSGQNLRAFSTQTLFNRFSSYDTAAGTNGAYFQEIVTTADMNTKTFTNAKGYLIRMPNNWVEVGGTAQPYLGSFTGTLNNGAVSIPLSGANSKLNLVGNPYASPISIATFFAANTNIDQTLYFWRKKASATPGNNASGYATYTSLGIVSADASINGTTPTNIEVGQGFFVIANSVTPGNLVFNNTMRNNGAATFYKSSNDNTAELHRFWLNLSNATNVVGQTLIGYKTGATQGIDAGVDALYFNDSATALTSLIDNSEYIIQGRNVPFVDTDIVPLGFKSDVAGSYTIGLSNFDGLFAENQAIYLKDNTTGTLHNLKLSDYTFTSSIGIFNTRFEVQYSSALGTNNPELAANSILIGVKDQKININAGTITMDKIELIDVAGRVIYTKEGVNATTARLENVVSSNQMLIVRISTKENGVVSQKIIF